MGFLLGAIFRRIFDPKGPGVKWDVLNLEGLIPIFGVVMAYLMLTGKYPRNPKNPEKMKVWRERWGGVLRFAIPVMIVFGVLKLIGVV